MSKMIMVMMMMCGDGNDYDDNRGGHENGRDNDAGDDHDDADMMMMTPVGRENEDGF